MASEELIRSEMQSFRKIGFNLCQTGVVICTAAEAAIVLVRGQIYDRLVVSHELTAGQAVPLGRFLLGTLALVFVATIFSGLVFFVMQKYDFYHRLLAGKSETPVPQALKGSTLWAAAVFFAFPVGDLLFRALSGPLIGR
jgi:hypothetical protein